MRHQPCPDPGILESESQSEPWGGSWQHIVPGSGPQQAIQLSQNRHAHRRLQKRPQLVPRAHP
eukprot:scaffold2889_cov407-Prasinococcus_capsulatus_cf.AAC.10